MKVHTLRNLLTAMALTCLLPVVNAQFDDVYYDPDNVDLSSSDNGSYYDDSDGDGITYYDDDSYEYYDDYDYYYSSRIRRFHRPYSGFGFYDPCYVSFNYYDPFYYDSYFYPGASIYISFGDDYWGYRNWRRWQRWNRWNSYSYWNNWYMTPSFHYYSYNSWCSPSYNYWGGGYHGYHSYSNYYNNYYNSCPSPVSNYYGITHGTVTTVNHGNTRGSYYGPRVTGNTGSSPRGPVGKPENIQPVMKGSDSGVTQSNDIPREAGDGTKPGAVTRSNPSTQLPGERTNVEPPFAGQDPPTGVVRDIPVDREIKRDDVTPTSKRPVFRPYPSGEKSGVEQERPSTDKPTYRPTEENKPSPRDTYTPRPSNDRGGYAPPRDENKPQYQPAPGNSDNRPRYTPPSRNNADDDKPSYKPEREDRPNYTPRNEPREERPSYTPSQRSNDSGRSNDRPSYSPPSRNDSGSSRSSSPPRESSGSSRSGSSNNSPRGRG